MTRSIKQLFIKDDPLIHLDTTMASTNCLDPYICGSGPLKVKSKPGYQCLAGPGLDYCGYRKCPECNDIFEFYIKIQHIV